MYLTHALHRALEQWPDEVMTVDGDCSRTTREVADSVARLAGALQRIGVGTGNRVGIVALNSAHHHEVFFASWWAGAVANPINTRWSAAEIAYALTDSGTEVLFVDDAFAHFGPELRERAPGLRTLIYCGAGPTPEGMLAYEELVAGAAPVPHIHRGGDELAMLLYTGGTTGKPKGVMVTHRSFMTSLLSYHLAGSSVKRGGATLCTAPLFHIGALLSWYGQTLLGGTLVFLPTFTPEAVLGAIDEHRVTGCALVPAMIQRLCEHPDFDSYDVSSLEFIGYGASGTPQSLLDLAMKHFPSINFVHVYGMTETGVLTVLGGDEHRTGGARLRSVGRATPTVEIAVVDPDGHRLPPGQIGEVVTRGDHVMAGYWRKPEATATALRDGWMHTGDGGYLDEAGYLYIVDRLKDMIITGGENVYSAEVENALAAHPAVASCAVIGVPDPDWGERVHAVIVPRPGHTVTAEELRAHTKTLIAGYKAPRTVDFVGAMPVSGTGKILKRELRAAYTDRDTTLPTTSRNEQPT
ncbi:acyl-CoA synthetase [Rhodococcus koreensis]|uniref:acyl-CoA synthetase n=1 Tax=Rhodococcus koreensis TaxID=99653 RepID=UPI001981915D|nr:long-chain fatty acid--CoA ligase [Rhodococcus koreensis]QSE78140.1 long-chain fatty acid--CoA ligase [Rhodococcus koreensis]